MQKRPLGKTGLEVSVLGFGAIKLPNISPDEAFGALNRALDLGMNFIDTARAYKESESLIGAAVSHRRDEYVLATKTGARDAGGLREHLETSLRNLRTDHVDLYQLHTVSTRAEWERVTAPGGALEEARRAQQEGLVGHIGITIHREYTVMREAVKSGAFATIMLAYSPLDQEGTAAEIMPMAHDHDMGVIIMKPLSGGLLAYEKDRRRPGLGGPDAIVAEALRFIIANPAVTCAIPGIAGVQEVEENIAVVENHGPLSEAEYDELLHHVGSLERDFRYGQVCLRCGYCLPCPQDLEIPEIFRVADMKRAYADDLKYLADEAWQNIANGPEKCKGCGACMAKCPAGVDIIKRLKECAALFTE